VSRSRRLAMAAHLPSLAALAVAMAAAAASYVAHVDRSASSPQAVGGLARPAARADHRRADAYAHRTKRGHHRTHAAHRPTPRPSPPTIVVTRVVAQRRTCPPARATTPAPDPARADARTERAVDRQLQEVIDQRIPGLEQP
jgi:hypothetical protein